MTQPAHNNYKVPRKEALKVIKKVNFSTLRKSIIGSIKDYIHVHGTEVLDPNSLGKRVYGGIKEHLARLLLDRYLIDWLCTNRIDLAEIDGELRNGLLAHIKEEDKKCQT